MLVEGLLVVPGKAVMRPEGGTPAILKGGNLWISCAPAESNNRLEGIGCGQGLRKGKGETVSRVSFTYLMYFLKFIFIG